MSAWTPKGYGGDQPAANAGESDDEAHSRGPLRDAAFEIYGEQRSCGEELELDEAVCPVTAEALRRMHGVDDDGYIRDGDEE